MEAAAQENPMALTLLDSQSEEPNETEGVGQEALQSFATPSSTQRTISTLGTEDDKGEDLPLLKIVFHFARIVNDGKEGWECGWCGKIFAPRHASMALLASLKNQEE